MAALDSDGNGLYDDKERKALLEVLQSICPDLDGPFDADGDGSVTIQEQSADRNPLSMIISPAQVAQSDVRVPWAIDIFPEWISTAYLQEDAAVGTLDEHLPRGIIPEPATQASAEFQPSRSSHRGVEFAKNSGQYLTMKPQRDARWNYRWSLFTFRIDADSGRDSQTVLVDVNHGNGPLESTPKIWFDKESGLNIQYLGLNRGGVDRRVMSTQAIVADGKTWNVVVCGIRYGQMFASVNGVSLATDAPQPPRFSGTIPRAKDSRLGDQSKGNMEWAYDALVFGLTEPSEAMVRKMTGWAAHRLDFQSKLPADHPYRDERPVLDAEDLPERYRPNEREWTDWGESLKDREYKLSHAGETRSEPSGFERVFFDDFRADRVSNSSSGEGDLWTGYGFNVAVGANAPLIWPGEEPNAYPYDAEKQQQTLSLVEQGKRWRGSAIYSVNDMGYGFTWKGPKVFRIRCMLPEFDQKDLPGGLFPAFWSYDPDFLFWRTANRIECDWFEFDGQNGSWYNGIASHLHYVHVKNMFAKRQESYKSYKVYGDVMKESKSKIPGGLFAWDGNFHTWEFVIDHDTTYVNVTVPAADGKDQWVEICRAPTSATYLERLDLQIDLALKSQHGNPKSGQRQDFVIDWIETLQKTDQIQTVPEPFLSRPALSGDKQPGNTITCTANVEGVTDLRFYWFADGYPLTWGPDRTYTLTDKDADKQIRCMVKAVGARNSPEAWSGYLK